MRTLRMVLGFVLIGLFFLLFGIAILGVAMHFLR
jgi:hypothetical protein